MPPQRPEKRERERVIPLWQWERHKEKFIELYSNQKLPLAECINIMETQHSFTASRRQYLAKIRDWNIDKNIKPGEMRVAVRKVLERWVNEGKDTSITVRGVTLTRDKLKRFLRREESKLPHQEKDEVDLSRDSSTAHDAQDEGEAGLISSLASDKPTNTYSHGRHKGRSENEQSINVASKLRKMTNAKRCGVKRDGQAFTSASKTFQEHWQIATPSMGYDVSTPASNIRGLHTPSLYRSLIAPLIQTVVKTTSEEEMPNIPPPPMDSPVHFPTYSAPLWLTDRMPYPSPARSYQSPARPYPSYYPHLETTIYATPQNLVIQQEARSQLRKTPKEFVLLCKAATLKGRTSSSWREAEAKIQEFLADCFLATGSESSPGSQVFADLAAKDFIMELAKGDDDHVFVSLESWWCCRISTWESWHTVFCCDNCGSDISVTNLERDARGRTKPRPIQTRIPFSNPTIFSIDNNFSKLVSISERRNPIQITVGMESSRSGLYQDIPRIDMPAFNQLESDTLSILPDLSVIPEVVFPTSAPMAERPIHSVQSPASERLDLESLPEFDYEEYMAWIQGNEFQDDIQALSEDC
ncbi:hypothetical protein TWF694_002669 [Orbilia ellipsospora]|uniref:Clr5 domain-containing protein n=1 Tax=Orbilia ellipsospora TaxID=2528407 RepID=A0AAV9X2M3_9PEZI